MTEIDAQSPPKPRSMKTQVERNADLMRVRCHLRQWGAGLFMLLWLTGWTAGCLMLAYAAFIKREPGTLLFGVPFWASWVFVFFLLLKMFFQKDELVVDREGVVFRRQVIVKIKERRIPLGELKRVEKYTAVTDSESGRTESGLEIVTLGKSLRCFQGLSNDELSWLQWQLSEQLAGMAVSAGVEATGGDLEVGPPTDSSWRRVDGFNDIGFVQRGQFVPSVVGMLLFINVFWNGIVSVFVGGLWGVMPFENNPPFASGFWWTLFVFLIPFEVIGLFFVAALISAVFEPAHCTWWKFSDTGIEQVQTWFGNGPRWSWNVAKLNRIELRLEDPQTRKKKFFRWNINWQQETKDCFELLFIDAANNEVCRMGGLTEGEGRWVSETVKQFRAGWFR